MRLSSEVGGAFSYYGSFATNEPMRQIAQQGNFGLWFAAYSSNSLYKENSTVQPLSLRSLIVVRT